MTSREPGQQSEVTTCLMQAEGGKTERESEAGPVGHGAVKMGWMDDGPG